MNYYNFKIKFAAQKCKDCMVINLEMQIMEIY